MKYIKSMLSLLVLCYLFLASTAHAGEKNANYALNKFNDLLNRGEVCARVDNNSDKKTGFFIMALYGTTEKTAMYYKPLKCYIDQAIVSDPIDLEPGQADVLTLNANGKSIVNGGILFGAMIIAVQMEIITDDMAGQYKNVGSGAWVINMDTKQRVWVPGFSNNKNQVVVKNPGKSYFTKITSSWMSNPKIKKLRLSHGVGNVFSFPADFVFDKKVPQDFNTPNYAEVIKTMKAAEEKMGDKIFEAQLFNENTLKGMPIKDVYNIYSAALSIMNKPIVYHNASLGSLFALGKYKYMAAILVQAAIGVILTILSGGAAASLIGDLVQQAVSTGTDLGQEISDIKKRG